MPSINIRPEGATVLFAIDGKGYVVPWDKAEEIAKVMHGAAKRAEEFAKANQIIADHALLTRVGVPIGLSNNPKIQDEVRKEAAWNSALRRYLPGGVKSREVFGTPAISGEPPAQSISPGGIASTAKMGVIGGS